MSIWSPQIKVLLSSGGSKIFKMVGVIKRWGEFKKVGVKRVLHTMFVIDSEKGVCQNIKNFLIGEKLNILDIKY